MPPRPRRDMWDGFRAWPTWAQWTVGILVVPLVIGAATGEGETPARRTVVSDGVTTLTLPVPETTTEPPTAVAATTTTIPPTTQAPTTVTTTAPAPATTRATVATTVPATPETTALVESPTPGSP